MKTEKISSENSNVRKRERDKFWLEKGRVTSDIFHECSRIRKGEVIMDQHMLQI